MIEDVVEGIFRALGRFIGQMFLEVIFEVLLKGPGYFLSKLFTKDNPDPDGFVVIITGIVFWFVVGFGVYSIYSNIGGGGSA